MKKPRLKFAVLKAKRSPVPASFFGMILGPVSTALVALAIAPYFIYLRSQVVL